MIFPRMCALSEVVWSPKDSRNWADFANRFEVHSRRLDELGVNYRPGTSEPAECLIHQSYGAHYDGFR